MKVPTFKQFISKPPILFPFAALFHLIFTLYAVYSLVGIPLSQKDWLWPLAMLLFTSLSFALCLMRKWAAVLYVLLSISSIALIYGTPIDSPSHIFGAAFVPFNLILSFFILLFFKRFSKA